MAKAAPVPPVVVEGRLRVTFIATKPIQAGDDITWDYGVHGEPWLSKQGNTLVTLLVTFVITTFSSLLYTISFIEYSLYLLYGS